MSGRGQAVNRESVSLDTYLAYRITPALASMAIVTVLFAAATRTTPSARA